MKKIIVYLIIVLICFIIGYFIVTKFFFKDNKNEKNRIVVKVQKKDLKKTVQAPGVVEPVNKVQIIPPTAGRIDTVFVEEGVYILKGQKIAIMSSTNRAALMDMMKDDSYKVSQEEKKSLDEAYLPIPIFSPASGQITKNNVVPGQTVNQQSVLFELSSELIARAQIDETDLKGLYVGLKAEISVDAFPGKIYPAEVTTLALESKIINNINVYLADIKFTGQTNDLRSGMSANIEFVLEHKEGALALPAWIFTSPDNEKNELDVQLKNGEMKTIQLGLSDGSFTEVIGLKENEEIIAEYQKIEKKAEGGSSSPFMPKIKLKNKR